MKITVPYQRQGFTTGTYHADTSDPDKFTIQTTQDLDPIIDFCREKEAASRGRAPDGMVHVAEIPLAIYEQAVMEGWDTPDGWKAWANRTENAIFRTWKGQI